MAAALMAEMTVPLVALPGGLWGSSSPAWDHLINRESSGRPYVIQEIHDVNSGGNEAEGLFQITPKTWQRHNGTDFAPSARLATPQQQAMVAARIFTRNPTGSDWGAGRPGREDPRDLAAGLVPVSGAAPAPVWRPEPYGMPRGSNSGGYGNTGVRFPDWVYALGNAFGLKPSTYPGHQESNRNEAGYAPNPQGLNRGIDWAAPGAPDEVDRMQRFADYLFSIRGELEQVIWWNPRTNKRIGVAGGKDVTTTPYYDYPGGYDDHRDHVHTRQSHSLPIPGGAAPVILKPSFTELDFMTRGGRSNRSRPPINWLLHTEEGNSSAEELARYCDGSHDVSYHYTVRDGIVCDVVDTDYASWSVLAANAFTINLCFAGSRAAWTRTEWLQRERDIEIAAYLAVQDCRKYNFSTEVIAPPYGAARPGISDHKYVTQVLRIGDHTDVGDNFPWDVFTRYVNKYANPASEQGEDDLSAEAERKIDALYNAFLNDTDSLSPFRPLDAGSPGPVVKLMRYTDASVHVLLSKLLASLGHPETVINLKQIAQADPQRYPDRQQNAQLAQAVLAEVEAEKQPQVINNSVDPQVVYAPAVDNTRELADAYATIAQLRDENSRLRDEAAVPHPGAALTPIEARTEGESTGQVIGRAFDALESLRLADALPIEERAPLAALISVLSTKNGSQV